MADVSLDELIRKRSASSGMYSRINSRAGTGNMRSRLQLPTSNRPVGTSFQRTFDARQKIGVTDARMKLGMKDAREKLVAKDARFRITGKVQDAREMLNSRKQHGGENPAKVMDAREKLSLKRSAPSLAITPAMTSGSSTINLTKTIQIPQQKGSNTHFAQSLKGMRINVVNVVNSKPTKQEHTSLSRQLPSRLEEEDDEDEEMELSSISAKQMKITATSTLQKRALPLTKVVQNDTYTAPVVPQTATPTSPLLRTKTLTNMSRTLVTKEDTAPQPLASTEPVFSPLEGTKMTVNNLHPRVTEEDIVELFCVCGALKRARLLSPGVAEVVFVRKDDAVGAYKKYNNRYLDGQPMKCNLHLNGSVITSDQPILLRLSDTPSATKKAETRRSNTLPSSSASNPPAEVDPDTILKALFKSSGSSAVVQPTAFKIKL